MNILGGYFDLENGIFNVPYDGIYSFTVSIQQVLNEDVKGNIQ